MRRLALTLDALAFLWACAATVYLVLAAGHQGVSTISALTASDVEAQRVTVSLVSAEGVWVVGLLLGVTLLAGLPLGVGLALPVARPTTTWTAGLLLLGFAIVSGFSLGLFYLPSAVLLVVAGVVSTSIESDISPRTGSDG
jgi:hypothetical protein